MNGKELLIGVAEVKEENSDLPLHFRPVAARFGRKMFSFVMNAGIAGEAAGILQQRSDAVALRVLTNSYNQLVSAYVEEMGWKEEKLAACQSAIQLAFAGQIQVVENKLILPENMH